MNEFIVFHYLLFVPFHCTMTVISSGNKMEFNILIVESMKTIISLNSVVLFITNKICPYMCYLKLALRTFQSECFPCTELSLNWTGYSEVSGQYKYIVRTLKICGELNYKTIVLWIKKNVSLLKSIFCSFRRAKFSF